MRKAVCKLLKLNGNNLRILTGRKCKS